MKRAVTSAGNLGVVMRRVDLPPDQPAHSAADQNVAREMVLTCDPGDAHACGKAITQDPGHGSRILVGQQAGGRPGERRMYRRKRRTHDRSLSKPSLPCPV